MTAMTLVKGFENPTNDSQQVFRHLLKAMSEPGTLVSVHSPESLDELNASTLALCQTLMDQQTALWLSPHFDKANIKYNLHFHTGVPIVKESQQAQFALMSPEEIDAFDNTASPFPAVFSQGSNEYPETGCTVIFQVSHVQAGLSTNTNLRLTGPGIETERLVSIRALPPSLLHYLSNQTGQRNTAFPLGLDCIFIDQTQLFCLPRTTQVEVL